MPDGTGPAWLDLLVNAAHGGEALLRQLAFALGLADPIGGQPAWPLPWRFSDDMLRIDGGLARRTALAAALLVSGGVLAVAALLSRRIRVPALAAALLAWLFVPWTDARLLFVEAYPTTFHRSPSGFTAASIVAGREIYRQHCAECHGTDGRGNTPRGAVLPKWPPTLAGTLLWQRTEGELFWRVQHGMHERDGSVTMPAFAGRLSDADTWAVLDYLTALAAGASVAQDNVWARPVAAPDAPIVCRGRAAGNLHDLRGQRVRIVFPAPNGSARDDPRFTTVAMSRTDVSDADCVAQSSEAWEAYALVAGLTADALTGTQFLVDRAGWMRARGRPGSSDWSDSDYLCRPGRSAPATASAPADPLAALIARIDAEPLTLTRGRFRH